MPPRKESCRNFMRGSCQYGDRCKFLHVSPQPSKPNPFGFGTQTGNQFQHTNLQPQKTNPFGFGVQNNSQSRGPGELGSKQNQFKPFENKWTRFSPINASSSSASPQPDNQPVAPSHKCTDPESCNRQIVEDFEQERPLWKLTCYSHSQNGPCDIVGDLSYEELRAAAYDDAKRGLSLQLIVEKERNLVSSKLLEFESLVRNPSKGPQNSALSPQNPFASGIQNAPVISQSSIPPTFSSFSQFGVSLNPGATATAPNSLFGQTNPFQNNSQTSSRFQTNNLPFGTPGSFGSQFSLQTPQSLFGSSSSSFGNTSLSVEKNPFSTSAISSQISGSAGSQNPVLFTGPSSVPNGIGSSVNMHLRSDTPSERSGGDNSIWNKEEWSIGEIPEEAPPDRYCR